MQHIKEKVSLYKFIRSPIKSLKWKSVKEPLLPITGLFIVMAILAGIISANFTLNNETLIEVKKNLTVEKDRLKIFLILIIALITLLSAFTNNIIIAFVYKVIFIISQKDINFRKVYCIFFYLGIISLLGIIVNGGISILFGLDEIQSFSNLSFIKIDNIYIITVFKLIDVFVIIQIYMLALFLKEIVCYSRWINILILVIHTTIMYVSQFFT
ncbi:YIP1 family protein [Bacillus mycoides]|uniref:YIP1 family protein n=1 Tax=Bacillus mycoides TaxID=1405 RepID=UPI0021111A8F|nr:YIP1 family protein [Bacillus mycoides]MCQ6527838.1 YIP1 family protein [Bacillus mycoides]